MKLQGILASVATPFDHTGAIYRTKVQHNFEKWCRTSLAGFVVGSPAGEGSLLEASEKLELLRLAAPVVGASRLLILDVSAEGVKMAADLAEQGAEAGAAVVISSVPFRYRETAFAAEAQANYFRALADRSPVPVLVNNSPAATGVDLSPAAVAGLAAHPNIIGVVESGTPPGRIQEIRSLTAKGFAVLSGTDAQFWDALKAGDNGAVLTTASAAPYATIAVWEAFRTREEEAGVDWQARIAHPSHLITSVYGPAGLKHAMDLTGYYGGPPRLPYAPVPVEARAQIEDAFRDLKG